MVEVYRDCMYDTMVLYLAVFPENEVSRRQADVRIFRVFLGTMIVAFLL